MATLATQLRLPVDFAEEPRGNPAAFPPIIPPTETRRIERPITPRRCAWLDWGSGRGLDDNGGFWAMSRPEVDVAEIVEAAAVADVERVFLTGGNRPHAGDNDAFYVWCHQAPDGWEIGDHYLERPDNPVLRFVDTTTGAKVEILRSATWWGTERDPGRCHQAWHQLAAAIESRWPGAVLMTTPATTGRELIARSIPHDVVWPTLPGEVAELIRSTSGQGRIELFRRDGDLAELVELDGRTMYGALCRELPGGRPTRGHGDHDQGPYARCRVLARWQVPDDWQHIGLLPTRSVDGWRYPADPGERASGWLDGVELHLARSWGWDVDVDQHIVWPRYRGAGPLDGWSDRLLALIDRYRRRRGPVAEMVAAGLRSILITALGALVGREHVVTRSTPIDESAALPMGAVDPRLEDDRMVWGERRPAKWAEMVHPEWSAAVWARCRTRMLDGPGGKTRAGHKLRTGALHVPATSLIAIRTDALYLDHDPHWPDDGAAGRLITKRHRPGPLPAPRSVRDLLALRDGASGGDGS